MSTTTFKDLVVWQRSADITAEIYEVFQTNRDYSFRDQIQRASLSIMNNIAEGHGRRSDKAFHNFIMIAKGSASEVESMLIIALRLGYIDQVQQKKLLTMIDEVSRLLSGLSKKLIAQDS